jgi:hypothetical protein
MTLMLFVVFPSAYYLPGTDEGGSMENVFDSLAMIRNSAPLQAVLLIFFLTVRLRLFCPFLGALSSPVFSWLLKPTRLCYFCPLLHYQHFLAYSCVLPRLIPSISSSLLQVACYNIFAIYVTHFLSSVWHAILDNFRPISVWGRGRRGGE